jgi:hypothetical protein
VVWQEEQTLLDGHHRHAICEQHSLDYRIQELSLPDLEAAKAWTIANQLGRRNLTPEQMRYFRGKQYEMQKQQGKRTDLTSHQSDGKSQSTVQVLADQHLVGTATIERDGAYARAIDAIAEVAGPEARQALLARETKLTQQEVKQLADVANVSPATVQEVMKSVQVAKTPKAAKQIVQLAVEAAQKQVATVGSGTLAEAGVPRATLARLAPKQDTPILTEVLDAETPADAPAPWPCSVATGDYEWYTPPEVLALVRQVLGTIEVDPASCAAAQAVVNATTYYTIEDDGLRHPWRGTVFCNPPYKMPEIARFVSKLLEELDAQHTTDAILLVNAVTETDWFQCIARRADALCFPDGRIRFTHATHNGMSPCQGQAVLYFGPQVARFCEVFAAMGLLMQVIGAKTTGLQLELAAAPPAPAAPPHAPMTREGAGSLIMAVYLMVKHMQPCTNAQVAKALSEERKRVHQALQSLVQQGKVRKEGLTYSVVPAPKGKAIAAGVVEHE